MVQAYLYYTRYNSLPFASFDPSTSPPVNLSLSSYTEYHKRRKRSAKPMLPSANNIPPPTLFATHQAGLL